MQAACTKCNVHLRLTSKQNCFAACDLAIRQDSKMALTKWFDNKPILMLSAVHAKHPEDECRRWCKQEKMYVAVKHPAVIHQ